jgi:hypothetical protein
MGGNTRVSLTGEVMEVAPPTPRPTGPSGAPGPPPRAGMHSPSAGPARPQRYGAAREVPQEKKSSAGAVVGVIVLLLVLGGGAFAWWKYQSQRGPVIATEKIVAATQKNDWVTVFKMVEWPPEMASGLANWPGGKDVAIQQMASFVQAGAANVKYTNPKIGDVVITGDTATVKVTMTAESPKGTKTETDNLHLKLVNGEWRLDIAKQMSEAGSGSLGGGMGMGGMGGGMGGPGGGVSAPGGR